MPVSVLLHLFFKPAHEIDKEGETIEAQDIRDLADGLHVRLHAAADAIAKLGEHGWEAQMTLYDVVLSHPYIESEADARNRIEDLGLDPEQFIYFEDEEDFDEEWEDDE